jgi:hypothetical protein
MVNSLTAITTGFPKVLESKYNNTLGTIDFSSGIDLGGSAINGDVNVLSISFTARADTQLTSIIFQFVLPRKTVVSYQGDDVLTGHTDGQLQIGYFNKISPGNGSGNTMLTPELQWDPSLGATGYDYCYDTTDDSACTNWTSNGTSTIVTLPELTPNTTYYWHVRAINGTGGIYTNDSDTAFWSFTTSTPTPVLLTNLTTASTPGAILLKWQTAQEIDLLGFNLYRSDALGGSKIRVNDELIPAQDPGGLSGNSYGFSDATAEAGKTYQYWVEWVGIRDTELYGPNTVTLYHYMMLPTVIR